MTPGISVIIAVYNKEDYLEQTIASVLAQTYSDFELVLWNDGSTDNSLDIINSFKDDRIRVYGSPNAGASVARNKAVENSNSEFLAFLDADDLWAENHLEELHRLRNKYPGACFFATNSYLQIGNQQMERKYSLSMDGEDKEVSFFEASMKDSIVNSSTAAMTKSAFIKAGGFDSSLKSGEDTDLFIRLGFDHKVVFSPRLTCNVIRTPESLSQTATDLSMKPDFSSYREKELEHPEVKAYLDLNRYALCLQARLNDDQQQFDRFYQEIDKKNLNKKQRFLLSQDKASLLRLKKIQQIGGQFGLRWGAF